MMPWVPTAWLSAWFAMASLPIMLRRYTWCLLLLLTAFEPPLQVAVVAIAAGFGGSWLVRRLESERHDAARRQDAGDFLLLLALEAASGSAVVPAIEAMAETLQGSLQIICTDFAASVRRTGHLRRGLETLASAFGSTIVDRLVAALLREQALGLSLRNTLERQLDLWRQEQWRTAEQRRQRLPYILTVSAALFLMSALLLYGYPRLQAILHGLSSTLPPI